MMMATNENTIIENSTKPTKKELIDMLDAMNDNIESLPVYALSSPASNMDLSALIILLSAIFKSDLDCK